MVATNYYPCYANLTGVFGRYVYLEEHSILYGRYIDGIIIIWDGDLDQLATFVKLQRQPI